jgi:hypothetical protein
LDWLGELAGDWRVDELPEFSDELDELDDEPDEPDEPVPEKAPDVPAEPPDDALLSEDVPEPFTAAWVAPGRTASTTPASATLAKDAVTVVAVSRRRPCSRSATARAS